MTLALPKELPRVQLGDLAVLPLVIGYCLCSSLLSVVNKAAIDVFPFPSLLTALQYFVSVAAVFIMGRLNILHYDPLVLDKVITYLPAAVVFYLAIFTNTTLLKYANLETFIVFRSSTPIIVAVADTFFRGQPVPSAYTFSSLGIIVLGAIGYVITDSQFSVRAYSWAFSYLAVITFEMVYIKHIIHNMKLNTWGYVFYNNILSLLMAPIFWIISGEYVATRAANTHDWMNFWTVLPVSVSCLFGLAISFFGFATRTAISATSFTVLGVTNKLLTVIVNVSIWDKHASPAGVACLLVTILGGVLYQQSVAWEKKQADKMKEIEESEQKAELLPLKGREGEGEGGKEKDLEKSVFTLGEVGETEEEAELKKVETGR